MMGPPDNNHAPPVFWTRSDVRRGEGEGSCINYHY